jgi:hypothetical protein
MVKRLATLLICLSVSLDVLAAPQHPCAEDAVMQAKKLLTLHAGSLDDTFYPISIDTGVRQRAPIRHPVYPKLRLDVLEVWASDAKGRFRMRFMYERSVKVCSALIGQEVLTYSMYSRHYSLD